MQQLIPNNADMLKKDAELADLTSKLQISESKNINLIKQITDIALHKPDGYIYIATCDYYAANNHYRIGRTDNLKSRLSAYQVGRTIKDQMYYVFEYKTEKVQVIELLIRKFLEEYRQDSAKDIYVIEWSILQIFVNYICTTFTDIVSAKNNLITTLNNVCELSLVEPTAKSLVQPMIIIEPVVDLAVKPIVLVDLIQKQKKCNCCNKYFTLKELKKHTSNITHLKCNECNSIFSSIYNLTRHINKKTSCNNIILKCIRCNKIFKERYQFDTHTNRKFPCKITDLNLECEQREKDRDLKLHIETEKNIRKDQVILIEQEKLTMRDKEATVRTSNMQKQMEIVQLQCSSKLVLASITKYQF